MTRVAAVGDIHMGPDSQGTLRPAFDTLPECADVLLLAGDLTRHGTPEEARVVAREIKDLGVPGVAGGGKPPHPRHPPHQIKGHQPGAGAPQRGGAGP
ncbi:metallophosphoesterase, partial [Streptomyces sp. NPDC127079]|uniref:metallophosphoesterase family protein n=1 Tax=Streptomyces sp. NPDC127079 TaxID=3347132 RepID=UPI00364F1A65